MALSGFGRFMSGFLSVREWIMQLWWSGWFWRWSKLILSNKCCHPKCKLSTVVRPLRNLNKKYTFAIFKRKKIDLMISSPYISSSLHCVDRIFLKVHVRLLLSLTVGLCIDGEATEKHKPGLTCNYSLLNTLVFAWPQEGEIVWMQGRTPCTERPANTHYRWKSWTPMCPFSPNVSEEGVGHYPGEAQRSLQGFNEVLRGVRQ